MLVLVRRQSQIVVLVLGGLDLPTASSRPRAVLGKQLFSKWKKVATACHHLTQMEQVSESDAPATLPAGSEDWASSWNELDDSQQAQLEPPHRPSRGRHPAGKHFDWRSAKWVPETADGVTDGRKSVRTQKAPDTYRPAPPPLKRGSASKKRKAGKSEEQTWQEQSVKHQDKNRVDYLIKNGVCAHRCLGINRELYRPIICTGCVGHSTFEYPEVLVGPGQAE